MNDIEQMERSGVNRRNLLGMTGVAALGVALSSLSAAAAAQTKPAGTDNFYSSDRVSSRKVSFTDQYRMQVAGNLFTPKNLDRSARHPALIVGHPMGAVKEQSANLYATKMAEASFVAMSIDLPFWGESEGQPRNAVSPDLYAEAFSAGVDFLQTQPFVDPERIGGIGICGSGSFILSAAKIDPRLKAIATASMYDMGAVNRNGLQHGQSVTQCMEIIAAAAPTARYRVLGRQDGIYRRHDARADRQHRSHPARVLRFLPHTAGRIHAPGREAADDDAPHADQQRQIHELLSPQRHRDDLAKSLLRAVWRTGKLCGRKGATCSPATAGAANAGTDQASPGRRHDISINSISAAPAQ
jgi:hypothetical protein